MAELIVELPEENKRFIIRYSDSDHIRKVLEQNATRTGPIKVPVSSRGRSLPEEPESPLPHEGASLAPANDANESNGQKKSKKKSKKKTR